MFIVKESSPLACPLLISFRICNLSYLIILYSSQEQGVESQLYHIYLSLFSLWLPLCDDSSNYRM